MSASARTGVQRNRVLQSPVLLTSLWLNLAPEVPALVGRPALGDAFPDSSRVSDHSLPATIPRFADDAVFLRAPPSGPLLAFCRNNPMDEVDPSGLKVVFAQGYASADFCNMVMSDLKLAASGWYVEAAKARGARAEEIELAQEAQVLAKWAIETPLVTVVFANLDPEPHLTQGGYTVSVRNREIMKARRDPLHKDEISHFRETGQIGIVLDKGAEYWRESAMKGKSAGNLSSAWADRILHELMHVWLAAVIEQKVDLTSREADLLADIYRRSRHGAATDALFLRPSKGPAEILPSLEGWHFGRRNWGYEDVVSPWAIELQKRILYR
jgi:hypothetical protein